MFVARARLRWGVAKRLLGHCSMTAGVLDRLPMSHKMAASCYDVMVVAREFCAIAGALLRGTL